MTMRFTIPAFAQLTVNQGSLLLRSSYDPALVAALKTTIPAAARKFDPESKAWIVAPQYGKTVAKIVADTMGITIDVPATPTTAETLTRLVQLDYLGQAKDRDGCQLAFGYSDGDWRLVFPLDVLRRWFGDEAPRPDGSTLYNILGISATAQPDEIKTAYRRAARQWHPDVCHEPDAAEQFKRINHAYELLRDPTKRARYDAGLQLQASVARGYHEQVQMQTWRPPLRCGMLLIEATEQVGRLLVSRILQWQDVVNPQGQIMVASWVVGYDKPKIEWSTP